MNGSRHRDAPERDDDRSHRETAELLETAGPRPEIPQDDLETIVAAGRGVWRASVEERAAARRSRRGSTAMWAAGLAAVLAVALGLGWWLGGWRTAGGGPGVGDPEEGSDVWAARVIEAWEAPEGFRGREMAPGAVVRTGSAGDGLPRRLALRLGPDSDRGTDLRLDEATRVRLVSASEVELEAGAVYVDTGAGDRGGRHLAIRTPYGTARDVGTRFLVRIDRLDPLDGPASGAALSVRVRDGRVELEHRGAVHRADGGEEMVVRSDGTVERHPAPGHGAAWDWVVATTPAFELEGRTLGELLDWVSRQTGWRVRYDDPGLRASTEGIVLHGTLNGLRPDQAPFAVLPGAGLEGEVDDGVLVIRADATP